MNYNLRDEIAKNIEIVLKEIEQPRPVLVTREPFDVEKIAITQFPAVLITPIREERSSVTMGAPSIGYRQGTIEFLMRGFVRGNDLDSQRSDLILGIESALESDRFRGFIQQGVTDSQVTLIEIVDRLPPLAEFNLTFFVRYNYARNAQ
jgi:hypothetical protein